MNLTGAFLTTPVKKKRVETLLDESGLLLDELGALLGGLHRAHQAGQDRVVVVPERLQAWWAAGPSAVYRLWIQET